MLKKWFEIIFDHRISLKERMFRLVTGISMIALIFILIMGRFTANLFILAGRSEEHTSELQSPA